MSFIPERDSFNNRFPKEQLDRMWALSEEMEVFFSDGNHADQCACESYPLNCVNAIMPWGYSVSAYEAIMYLAAKGELDV